MTADLATKLSLYVWLQELLKTRAPQRWERWDRVPSQFEILAAILADDSRTFVVN